MMYVEGVPLSHLGLKGVAGLEAPPPSAPRSISVPAFAHSIQCRLYAEDPSANFFPCVGELVKWEPMSMDGVLYDSGVTSGSQISVNYDPMIAKVVSWGASRQEAIDRMVRALRGSVCLGVTTNKAFLLEVLQHPAFRSGKTDTGFIGNHLPSSVRQAIGQPNETEAADFAVAGALFLFAQRRTNVKSGHGGAQRHWTNQLAPNTFAYSEQFTVAALPGVYISICMQFSNLY
jgi:acetyl/propionyl-CoA carboxylase alpha subunit